MALRRIPSYDSFLTGRDTIQDIADTYVYNDAESEEQKVVMAVLEISCFPTFGLFTELNERLAAEIRSIFLPGGNAKSNVKDGIRLTVDSLSHEDKTFVILYFAIELDYFDAIERAYKYTYLRMIKSMFGGVIATIRVETLPSHVTRIYYSRNDSTSILSIMYRREITAAKQMESILYGECARLREILNTKGSGTNKLTKQRLPTR